MLNRLHIRNFTVFAEANFEFGPGLNVLVGTNGTGKSHVLKLGYAVETAVTNLNKEVALVSVPTAEFEVASAWIVGLRNSLVKVFLTRQVGELIRRNAKAQAEVKVYLKNPTQQELFFQFDHRDKVKGQVDSVLILGGFKIPSPESGKVAGSVFIPAKEVLTMGWLLPLYERREVPIDETYPDLLRLLFGPPLRIPEPAHIVEQLQQLIGGKVDEEGGHFYLSAPDQPRMEMNLVAEGMRKFAILYKLLANGTLTPETTLFWDEPEANLNPALLKEMAAILAEMARAGFQIILATHSLFLMKELHILSQREKTTVRYFGLYAGEKGDTQVETKDDFVQLQHVVALDVELAQTYDFEDALDQDYAGDN